MRLIEEEQIAPNKIEVVNPEILLNQFMKKRQKLLADSRDGKIKEIEVFVDSENEDTFFKDKFSPEGTRFRDDFFLPEDFDLLHQNSFLGS